MTRPTPRVARTIPTVILVMLAALGGCNLITGVNDLTISTPSGGAPSAAGGTGSGGETESVGGSVSLGGGGNEGGMGGISSGGTEATGGAPGSGGAVPTDCVNTPECVHPDACLIGACEDDVCKFTPMQCDPDKICEGGECVCPDGEVDCGSGCAVGACCLGDTDGGCGRCGMRTCKGDQTGFECTGESGECNAGETCGTLGTWSDGTSCGCVLTTAVCDENCMKGPCE